MKLRFAFFPPSRNNHHLLFNLLMYCCVITSFLMFNILIRVFNIGTDNPLSHALGQMLLTMHKF